MDCLVCGNITGDIVDVRGLIFYEEKLNVFLVRNNISITSSTPLTTCKSCMNKFLQDTNFETSLLESPQSAMSEFQRSYSLALSENALTPSIPDSLNSQPLATQTGSISQRIPSSDSDFIPPMMTPSEYAVFNEIKKKPGPKSVKRKREDNFLKTVRTRSVEEDSPKSQEDEAVERLVQEGAAEILATKRPKPAALNTSNRSSSHTSNSLSSQEDFPNVLNRTGINKPSLSPRSSQLMQNSPPTDPIAINRTRDSSSLSSQESDVSPARTKPGPLISKAVPKPNPIRTIRPAKAVDAIPSPASSSSSRSVSPVPVTVQRIAPPNFPRTSDGNAHTNMGAPRRINYSPATMTGASSRDARTQGPKLTSGG